MSSLLVCCSSTWQYKGIDRWDCNWRAKQSMGLLYPVYHSLIPEQPIIRDNTTIARTLKNGRNSIMMTTMYTTPKPNRERMHATREPPTSSESSLFYALDWDVTRSLTAHASNLQKNVAFTMWLYVRCAIIGYPHFICSKFRSNRTENATILARAPPRILPGVIGWWLVRNILPNVTGGQLTTTSNCLVIGTTFSPISSPSPSHNPSPSYPWISLEDTSVQRLFLCL